MASPCMVEAHRSRWTSTVSHVWLRRKSKPACPTPPWRTSHRPRRPRPLRKPADCPLLLRIHACSSGRHIKARVSPTPSFPRPCCPSLTFPSSSSTLTPDKSCRSSTSFGTRIWRTYTNSIPSLLRRRFKSNFRSVTHSTFLKTTCSYRSIVWIPRKFARSITTDSSSTFTCASCCKTRRRTKPTKTFCNTNSRIIRRGAILSHSFRSFIMGRKCTNTSSNSTPPSNSKPRPSLCF